MMPGPIGGSMGGGGGYSITSHNIYWLAGWLEGEGAFIWNKARSTPIIEARSIDVGTVRRVAKLMGGLVRAPKYNGPKSQPISQVSVTGANAVGWMMTIYPLMEPRRRAQIRMVLEKWRARGKPRKNCLNNIWTLGIEGIMRRRATA